MEQVRWWQVYIDYATYGICSNSNDIIIDAAPIAKWMIGKTLKEIKPFLISKRATVVEIK